MTEIVEENLTEAEQEARELIEAINKLSRDACYMVSRDWFGRTILGKSALAVPSNDRQEAAFEELLDAGFVHGDVEGRSYGYRSTWRGQRAHPYAKAAFEGPPED